MTKVELLTIGDELLIGRTVNTNASWLGARLAEAGLQLGRISTLADVPADIHRALDRALAEYDLVILTGGLGPTRDDYTAQALADYVGQPLEVHAPSEARFRSFLAERNRPYTANHNQMLSIPRGSVGLVNPAGAAPGIRMMVGGKAVFALPGVPHEMKALYEAELLPWLQQHVPRAEVRYENWRLVVAESELANRLAEVEDALAPGLSLAYNPGLGMLDLRLGMRTEEPGSLDAVFADTVQAIDARVRPWCFARGNTSLSEAVGRALQVRGLTLSVAESCTAGTLARTLAETPGSSAWYQGGVLTYSNELKTKLIGVPAELLATAGAVSSEVATAMAAGVAGLCHTPLAISTTGIAGPDGGTPDKPVGTVWVGLHTPLGTTTHLLRLEKDRLRNMQRASTAACWILYGWLRQNMPLPANS
ncbi:MAG: CinA family nicotinamide mononucleotide deamidase-related protein [Sphingobacteriia bacterium]|jgi:nicotinamide-nucleotide amidase